MRVLFLSLWYPFPADNGSRLRIYNLIQQVARRHEVHLISFSAEPVAPERVQAMAPYCASVSVVPYRPFEPARWKALASFLLPRPRSAIDTYSQEFERQMKEIGRRHSPDLVIASQIDMLLYPLKLAHVPRLLEELQLLVVYDQYVHQPHLLKRMRSGLTWWKLKHYLAELLPAYDGCTVVSEMERNCVLRAVSGYRPLLTVPNGINLAEYAASFGQPERDTLVYAGSISYQPNFDAVAFFVREILPVLRRRRPRVKLFVTGRLEGVDRERLPVTDGLVFTGYLPDVRPTVARSWVSIAPLLAGGGTRIKILESLALGTPVVATTKGAEGLDLVAGRDILIANTPVDFATAVESVLENADLRNTLSLNGRQAVAVRYNWDDIGRSLLDFMEFASCCQKRRVMRFAFGPNPFSAGWLTRIPWLVRAVVILGLLAADVLVGLLAVRGNHNTIPLLILVAAATVLGLALLYRIGRFEFGILLIPPAAGLLNFVTVPTGTQSRIVISMVVAFALVALWILQWIAVEKRVKLRPSAINAPVLVFIAISLVSYGWSNILRDPLVIVPGSFRVVQLAALAVNISLPFLLLMVSNKICEMAWLRWLNWIVVGLGTLAVISFLLQLPSSALISNGARGVFPAWIGALVCGQALFNSKLARWQRAGLLALLAALIYYYFIMIPDWFSGWFPLGVGLGVVIFIRSKKLFLVACVAGAVFIAFRPDVITQNVVGQAQSKGDFERLSLWRNNLDLVVQHPILGVGPAGYAPYYMTYHPEDARSTHNNYFDVLAQTGVLGLLAFVWLQATLLRIGRDNCRRVADRHDFAEAFAAATLAGCVAAFAAMMLGDWVLPFAYNQTITGFDNASLTWILLGAAVSLHHILDGHDPVIARSESSSQV